MLGTGARTEAQGRAPTTPNHLANGLKGQAVKNLALGPTDAAARHLLHNLHNAKALRTNPLVAHLLQPDDGHGAGEPIGDRLVVSRITEAVAAVLRTLSPSDGNPFDSERPHRQAEIVRRCMLGTEPYKAVASDLGISLRTLFRDLDGIRLRLVEELPRYTPPSAATVAAASDTFELELRHAALLRNMGRFDDALVVLDRTSTEAGSPLLKARAWNASAVVLVESGQTPSATARVAQARAMLATASSEPAASRLLAESDIDLTDAMIARVNGDSVTAISRYDHAARLARPLLADSPAGATDIYVRALAQSATINWLIGNIDASARSVERAWNALEGLEDPPDAAHYAVLAASSLVRLVVNGDVAWAIREMSAAAVLAERHGMLHDALMALGWLSGLERLHGNLAASVATSRRTMAIARNTMTGTEFGLLCAAAAENEAEFGNAPGAAALIEEGRSHVAPGGSAWARLQLAEAGTLLVARRNAEAVVAAEKAGEAMARQGKAGFVGYAYLLKAQAHERRGENAQALLATREALPLLERFGKSPELIAAYELSARLAGDRSHRANAHDLKKLLGS